MKSKPSSKLDTTTMAGPQTEQPPEKYALRHRQKRSTRATNKQNDVTTTKQDASNSAANNEVMTISTTTSSGTVPQTKVTKKSSAKPKAKQKAAPLSKYRRKTANARERIRMREINSAFEHLRKCVPVALCEASPATTNEKLTKITTLRLAMKYIGTLNNILSGSDLDCETNQLMHSIINKTTMAHSATSDDFMNMNNNNNSLLNNNNTGEYDLMKCTPPVKSKRKSKKSEKTTNKTISKRRPTKSKNSTPKSSKSNKNAKKVDIFAAMPNTMSTICLTPPSSSTDSPIDLGLTLESDGESLHLSEPCLSPPLSSCQPTKLFNSALVSPSSSVTMSNGLDIGLFLDSDTDSLHFPEPCLSPLDAGFDALSPFGDLLHPGFAEHTSLDMYLT